MGIGDWGLGIGDWGLGPIPNPQSPIPNPQSPLKTFNIIYYNTKFKINLIFNLIKIKNGTKDDTIKIYSSKRRRK